MKRIMVGVVCLVLFAGSASTPGLAESDDVSTPRATSLAEPSAPVAQPVPVPSAPAAAAVAPRRRPAQPPARVLPASSARRPPAAVDWEAVGNQVVLDFQFCRIRGDIAGETSLTDNLWEGITGEDLAAVKGPFSFFTLANLTVAGMKFRADQNRWTWDGQERPSDDRRVEVIASPKVIVLLGESFEIAMTSPQPIEYFEKRSDGLFEIKRVHEQTGLTLRGKVEKGESGRLVVRNLTIGLRSIEKRKPIEGVSLDVGEPIINARECEVSIAVKPQCYYGIQLATEGYGFLILRLRAQPPFEPSSIPGAPGVGRPPTTMPGAFPGPSAKPPQPPDSAPKLEP